MVGMGILCCFFNYILILTIFTQCQIAWIHLRTRRKFTNGTAAHDTGKRTGAYTSSTKITFIVCSFTSTESWFPGDILHASAFLPRSPLARRAGIVSESYQVSGDLPVRQLGSLAQTGTSGPASVAGNWYELTRPQTRRKERKRCRPG